MIYSFWGYSHGNRAVNIPVTFFGDQSKRKGNPAQFQITLTARLIW
jgi:hypothetical protein